MNKTAIKNFSIWARNKLISDIQFRAQLLGVLPDGIREPLPQSEKETQFFDIGTKDYAVVKGSDVYRREAFVEALRAKARKTDYATAYKTVIEKIAYTWFNRLIAIRFMEVNDYLPGQVRVLSSRMAGKAEPDIVSTPFESDLEFMAQEQETIMRLKDDNKLDDLFRMLFISQCHKLSEILPGLFAPKEKSIPPREFYELLLNINFTDRDGLVWHLVNDIPERDFRVRTEADNLRQVAEGIPEEEMPAGQVEIIGWLYQYYNTELNTEVYDGTLSKAKIPKELIPAATTIYTPDWPIRYMVQNSLGRLWAEGHPEACARFMPEHNDDGSVRIEESKWNYYLEEAKQEPQAEMQLALIREQYAQLQPQDIKVIDPCCGSGHIAVYLFDVLMQIYETQGWTQREAAQSIVQNNLYALDIDDRATQLAYFAVMMKARQYDRRFFTRDIQPHVYAIPEWDEDTRKNWSSELKNLCNLLRDGKEYGSIIDMPEMDWASVHMEVERMTGMEGQLSIDSVSEETRQKLHRLIDVGQAMAQRYDVVVTNPPYLGSNRYNERLNRYIKDCYSDVKSDLCMVMYYHAINDMVKENGFVSFITTSSWMFLYSFETLRAQIYEKMTLTSLIDFGTELFEGKVGHNPIVAWTIRATKVQKYSMTGIRLVDFCYSRREEKEKEYFNRKNYYYTRTENFRAIPGAPVAYWVSEQMLLCFQYPQIRTIAFSDGQILTGDNERFLRTIWEVNRSDIRKNGHWMLHAKGGDYRKWYGNLEWVVDWSPSAIGHYKKDKIARFPKDSVLFRKGVTWNLVSSSAVFGARLLSETETFNKAAATLLFFDEQNVEYTLALLNSTVVNALANMLNPTLNTNIKDILSVPYITTDIANTRKIEGLMRDAVKTSKKDWDSFETSWDFQCHPLIDVISHGGPFFERDRIDLAECYSLWEHECEERFQQLKANEVELNRIFINIYGLQGELTPDVEDKDITVRRADLSRDVRSLISYAVGCMFGRYSINRPGLVFAGGDFNSVYWRFKGQAALDEAGEPIYGGYAGISMAEYHYPRFHDADDYEDATELTYEPDADNCLPITDEDYGLRDDIVNRFVDFIRTVYGEETLETNLDFIAHALGNRGDTSRDVIRNYFLNDFFKDHCQTYSVTGSGKRPIYWLFDSGKANGFKALVYMHRWNADTVGNLRVEYLHRMQRVYEKEIERMQDTIDNGRDSREIARATKRREKLVKQLKEARDYDAKIAHVALSRVEIDLDDGVKVNYEKVQKGPDGKSLGILAKI